MPIYNCYAVVTGSKYLGEVEAEDEEDAIRKSASLPSAHVSVCHQCSKQISDPEITDIFAEQDE